jgi:N-acetylneuraminic acid mutarotase
MMRGDGFMRLCKSHARFLNPIYHFYDFFTVVFNGLIYIFGGYNGLLDLHFNDLHCFDPVKNVWHLVETRGTSPKARRRQSCIVIGKKMYLFGGTW